MGKHVKKRRSTLLERLVARELGKREAKAQSRARKKAVSARQSFRPRKSERGSLVFVNTKGKRVKPGRARKGYPVYITSTGKKWLVRQKGKQPYRARSSSELTLPDAGNLRRKVKAFRESRLEQVGKGRESRPVVKREGSVKGGGSGQDFNKTVLNSIARSIDKAFKAQASHRIFLVQFNVLVRLPDGSTQVISGEVPIDAPDHIAVKLAGINAFVRHKFYSFMARELAFAGYVTSGSANHIRKLAVNKGKKRQFWKDRRGEPWAGRGKEQVKILTIEWKIEQAK